MLFCEVCTSLDLNKRFNILLQTIKMAMKYWHYVLKEMFKLRHLGRSFVNVVISRRCSASVGVFSLSICECEWGVRGVMKGLGRGPTDDFSGILIISSCSMLKIQEAHFPDFWKSSYQLPFPREIRWWRRRRKAVIIIIIIVVVVVVVVVIW